MLFTHYIYLIFLFISFFADCMLHHSQIRAFLNVLKNAEYQVGKLAQTVGHPVVHSVSAMYKVPNANVKIPCHDISLVKVNIIRTKH